jgi:hypothetical protein
MNRRHRDALTYGRFKTPWPSASGASGAIAPLDAARSNPKSTAAKAFADWRVGSRRRWGSTLLSGGCGHEGDNGATGRLDSIDIQGLAHQAPSSQELTRKEERCTVYSQLSSCWPCSSAQVKRPARSGQSRRSIAVRTRSFRRKRRSGGRPVGGQGPTALPV